MGFSSFHLQHKTNMSSAHVYVVVQFHPWFKFIFLCFGVWLCMIISLKQRKIKFKPRIKIEPKHIHQEVELLPTVEVIA